MRLRRKVAAWDDDVLANKHCETIAHLDAVVAQRCCDLDGDPDPVARHTNFHCWPKTSIPS